MLEDAAAFEEFADQHRESVWEEVLAPVREARGEPNWCPTGFMEGTRVSTASKQDFTGTVPSQGCPKRPSISTSLNRKNGYESRAKGCTVGESIMKRFVVRTAAEPLS